MDTLAREMQGRTPLSASLLLITILAVIGVALGWASFTWIDDVTRAQGKVVPAGDIQTVQAAENGLIRRVLVSEGQEVAAGAPLLELDAEVQNSQLDSEIQKSLALRSKIERLRAEVNGQDLSFSNELKKAAPELVASEYALHLARTAELAAQVSVVEKQREQLIQEQAIVNIDINSAERSLAIVEEERDLLSPLVEQGIEPRTTLLALRQKLEELLGRIAASNAKLLSLNASLNETIETSEAIRLRFRSEALEALTDATAELSSLQPSLPALQNLAERAVLRSPVHGVVNRIYRNTLGASVRAGEDLVEIVPLEDGLIVEAFILPQDIAFVKTGQSVRVKLTAYDFTRYGALEGTILRIGSNAIRRDERDATEAFSITVKTIGSLNDYDGVPVVVLPGMTAEVDILAGKRRVIDYLLQPLERIKGRAFQD